MRVDKERFKEELESYRKRMQRERHMHSKDLFGIMKQEIHGDGVQEAGDLLLDAQSHFQQFVDKIREAEQALEED
nr:hypothetical protein [uncultured archaeon]